MPLVEWLNYHHLLYFWMVAREGGITAAAAQLHLAQPTLSNQIRQLERAVGVSLFTRRGRRMELTETGQVVFRYANEIFSLGRELTDVLRGRNPSGAIRLAVGIPDVLPKLVVYRLLQPALRVGESCQLATIEGKMDYLLGELVSHRLDVVLSESPLAAGTHIRAFNHLLGECGLTFFAVPELARSHRRAFPGSLHGAPMLLPAQGTSVRRMLEQWFDEHQIRPRVCHEFQDSALLKVFGQAGEGIFTSPSAIEEEVCRQYRVRVVGRMPELAERFYAITVDRRLKHPAVVALTHAARHELFGRKETSSHEAI